MVKSKGNLSLGDGLMLGDKIVVLPPPTDREEDENDYIERVLDNAQDSIEAAKAKQQEEAQKKSNEEPEPEPEQIDEEQIKEETYTEGVLSSSDKVIEVKSDDSIKSESETEKKTLRKLTKFEKALICILMLLPAIEILLLVVAPANIYFVYTGISLLFVLSISWGFKQYSMVFVHVAILVMSLFIVFSGREHGMVAGDLAKRSITNLSYVNSNTPKAVSFDKMTDKEIRDKFKGKFIYYYKYGCKDCIAINAQLESFFEGNDYEMVAVETRSNLGKEMLKSYPVDEVPAGLIFENDGSYLKSVLYNTKGGESVIDNKKLKGLLRKLDEVLKDEK